MEHPYLKFRGILPGDVILDLGATAGDFALETLDAVKAYKAKIYCVEPEKKNYEALSRLCAEAPDNLIPVFGCSGKEDGEIELIVTDQPLLHHPVTTPKQMWDYLTTETYKVPCYTMNSLVEKAGGRINFVKCDIEGGEIDTFLSDDLWTNHVDYLAIAAYHVVGGIRTHVIMKPWFEDRGFSVIVEEFPDLPDRDMLYAIRRHA